MKHRRSLLAIPLVGFLALAAASAATAVPAVAHASTGVIRVAKGSSPGGNQSNNWFGYNLGSLERGGTMFHSISGNWSVPRASLHTKDQNENSSTWVGIGGGCVDTSCVVGDETLIQAGTEQDVAANGTPSYSAWWEVIPAPSITISNMTVNAGDHMSVSLVESSPNPEVWTIKVSDTSRNETFIQTVPYSSSHATAEWIEETPVVVDASGNVLGALPNLSTAVFSGATVNGVNPHLLRTEAIRLVDASGKVIGVPSAPNSAGNGFSDCAWRTTC